MVLGLLTIAAIPTTIGIAEGVSRRDEAKKDAQEQEVEQMRKFNLECYCESHSVGKARQIHRGRVVLSDGKMYIEPASSPPRAPKFEGFYIEYADNDRPKPLPMGMVSMVFEDKPTLNWIYVDRKTREVKYGNKTQSKEHVVGPWSWEAGDQGGPGGATLDGDEGAVAVETPDGWQVYWEDGNGKIHVQVKSKIQISLERKMVELVPSDTATGPQHETTTNTNTELTKSRYEDKAETSGGGGSIMKVTAVNPKAKKRKEPKLEVASCTTTRPMQEN